MPVPGFWRLPWLGVLLLLAGGLPAARATQVVYGITGSQSPVENSCTQIVFLIGGGECSYARRRAGVSADVPWFGPVGGAAYYAVGGPGDAVNPAPGTPTLAAPLGGSITIDDRDTPDPADDTIAGSLVIGAAARALPTGASSRAVERWQTFTSSFGATHPHAVVPNPGGGWTYTIASRGFPQQICSAADSSDCFPSPNALPSLGGEGFWSGPEPTGTGIEASALLNGPDGNLGVAPSAFFTGYSCNDNDNASCFGALNLLARIGSPGWTNLLLQVTTNGNGKITSGSAYWLREYRINYGNPPPDNNSWNAGRLSFTGSIPGPVANDDSYTVPRDGGQVAWDVMANDLGFNAPVSVSVTAPPQHGTAEITGSPGNPALIRLRYTPAAGYAGPDSLVYQVGDGEATDTAAVAIVVSAPDAHPDVVQTRAGVPVAINVLANDQGLGGQVAVTLLSSPGHGTAQVINSPGQPGAIRISYTPAGGYAGVDSFIYQVSDGLNASSASVSVDVQYFQAGDDQYVLLGDCCYESLYVLNNDLGFTKPVGLSVIQYPDRGTVFVSTDASGSAWLRYLPDYSNVPPEYTTTLRYQVSDATATDTATVTVRVVPFAALDDQATTTAGAPVLVPVVANDLGFGSQPLVGIFTNPQHGSVQLSPGPGYYDPPRVSYTPAPGFLGVDTFEYAIETSGKVDTALVTVRVIVDADGDQADDGLDNCLGAANADQRDGDGDGYGTWCDGDFNNDGRVNFADLSAFRLRFGTTDAGADFNGDGAVNLLDLGRFKALFGGTPGPSALVP